jgi:hypothetical protein
MPLGWTTALISTLAARKAAIQCDMAHIVVGTADAARTRARRPSVAPATRLAWDTACPVRLTLLHRESAGRIACDELVTAVWVSHHRRPQCPEQHQGDHANLNDRLHRTLLSGHRSAAGSVLC